MQNILFLQDTPAYLGTALGDIRLNRTDNTVLEAAITQLFYFLKQVVFHYHRLNSVQLNKWH